MHDAIFGIHSQPPVGRPVTRQPWLEEAQARQSEAGLQDGVGPVIWLASLQSAHGRCDHSIMPDLERALINPAGVFRLPNEVVLHPLLSLACKREILGRWAWDEYLIETAQSEGGKRLGVPDLNRGAPARHIGSCLRKKALGRDYHDQALRPALRQDGGGERAGPAPDLQPVQAVQRTQPVEKAWRDLAAPSPLWAS